MKKNSFFLCIAFTSIAHSVANDTTTFHSYFWANYNHFAGNLGLANNWYKNLFSSKNSIYTYNGYLSFLADTKQYKQIIQLMPSLSEKFAQNPDVQLIFVNALQHTNQSQKADNLLITLSQTFKTHPEITLQAAQTYIKRQEAENALLTINAFLNNTPRRPNNFVFYFLQCHVHIQLNQLPQALQSIQLCLEMHPAFDKGWLLYASLHEKEGKIKEALSGYATFLELAGSNSQVEKHLFTLMLKYKALEDNKQTLLSQSATIDNALILFKNNQPQQALLVVNRCIAEQPTNDEYKLFKIQVLCAIKNFTEISSTLAIYMTQDLENVLWPKALSLLAYNGMPRIQIAETFSTVLTKHPDNLWCNLYCAENYMRNAQNDLAIACLEKAASSTTENSLKAKVLYQLALLHYDQNNYQLMKTNLEQAHALNGNCPHVNNTLAYYWATKGKDTKKALAFIEKALAHSATNPYFLDTHALILYKEKKYEQAQQILEQLALHENGTMLLHLAKVHYALNNRENADTFTKKAQHLVKNNHEKKALHKMQLLLAQT